MATESHGQFHANLLSRYSKSCAVLGIIPSEAVCDRLLRNANGVNADSLCLDLSRCGLECQDVQVLSALLEEGESPHGLKIDVSYNRVGDGGAVALSELLSPTEAGAMCDIAFIDMSHNVVGEIGGLAVCNAVSRRSASASDLVLVSHNPIPSDVLDVLAKAAEHAGPRDMAAGEGGASHDESNDFPTEVNSAFHNAANLDVESEAGSGAAEDGEGEATSSLRTLGEGSSPYGTTNEENDESEALPDFALDLGDMAKTALGAEDPSYIPLADTLDLSNSQLDAKAFEAHVIRSHAESAGFSALTVLNLSSNGLQAVPRHLPPSLRTLVLRENAIEILEHLHCCPSLHVLDASCNRLGVGASKAKGILRGLCLFGLRELSLANNGLSDMNLASLVQLGELECLDLSNNTISPGLVLPRLAEMEFCASLHTLEIADNKHWRKGGELALDYRGLAARTLPALRTLDGEAIDPKLGAGAESTLAKLFKWKRKRSAKGVRVQGAGTSAGDAGGREMFDFSDVMLLAAKLGLLETPQERSSFVYFSKTSESLWLAFQGASGGDGGCMTASQYAAAFDRIQRESLDAISGPGPSMERRAKMAEYIRSDALQGMYASMCDDASEEATVCNRRMDYLRFLRWLNICFLGKKGSQKQQQQTLLVRSFFTKERRLPDFNYLDFIFAFVLALSMGKQTTSPAHILKYATQQLRERGPPRVPRAAAQKRRPLGDVDSNVPRALLSKGVPAKELVKQRDAAVLVHMLERGAAEQAAAVSEDCARMHVLRTSLKRAAEDMRRLC